MSVLITLVSIILLSGLFILPVLILNSVNKSNIRFGFITYLALALLITFAIMFIFSWWSVASDEILLSNYGYDFEALNDTKRYANIKPEDVEQVKNIEINLSGIGWPLQTIFSYAFYFPYLLIVYLINYIIRKRKVSH